MRIVALSIFYIIYAGFISGNIYASQYQQPDPDSALARTLAQIKGEPISLEQAVNLSLENATLAREAKASLEASVGAMRREKGGFDPELFAETQIRNDDQPTASPFSGASVLSTKETSAAAGARGRRLFQVRTREATIGYAPFQIGELRWFKK